MPQRFPLAIPPLLFFFDFVLALHHMDDKSLGGQTSTYTYHTAGVGVVRVPILTRSVPLKTSTHVRIGASRTLE